MLAFHAPPAAVIQPVVRAGKMPGSQSVRHFCQPLRWVSCVQARRSCGMALGPEITLKRIYQIVPKIIRITDPHSRLPCSRKIRMAMFGNTSGEGNEAAIWVRGIRYRDSLGLEPIQTPIGTAMRVLKATALR